MVHLASMAKVKQQALDLENYSKRDVRTQFGALCWRLHNGKIQVLLVTSRRSRRWIIPKGWPQDGATPVEAAASEAWEEAGVTGVSDGRCIGIFSYSKDTDDLGALPCVAMVFAIEVQALADDYPEAKERKRLWVSRKKAAKLVDEPELSRIIRDFDPRLPS